VSVFVKWTVPVKPGTGLLFWSRAVTVMLKAAPAVAPAGAPTAKCVAAEALTVRVKDWLASLPTAVVGGDRHE